MLHKNKRCVDAGTWNCPCRLADFEECLVCSRMAGEDRCDCQWQGVCIYNEFMQNGNRINQQRDSKIYRVQKKIWYEKDLAVMRIEVPRGFAEIASLPGSCVFVKKPGMEAFFDTPVSVLRMDYESGTIDLAIKVLGPKTKSLLRNGPPASGCSEVRDKAQAAGGLRQNGHGSGPPASGLSEVGYRAQEDFVEMRGVYRNGLLGAAKLSTAPPKRVLCLAKGVGLAPVINYSRWAAGKDHIDLVVDTEKVGRRFAEECLVGCQVNSVEYRHLPIDLEEYRLKTYDLVVLSASDYYQHNIYIPEEKRVISNNNSMCCGEGLCGACIFTDNEGHAHRMCKCSKIE